jgi:UDP-N-acetylglucosamine--N-acetylmuramyl-(pentapeptide) pyrophosphoryl-undecaprenol N-acetylglucosamine transferase
MHIIFTGGGSLGPVTPLIAVMRSLRELQPDASFSWIGTRGGVEERIVQQAGMSFHAVSSGKLRRYLDWQNLTDLGRIVAGFFQSIGLLRSLKADVVVSAGGFVAVPVAWAAWVLRIPVHVHQQDVVPGLANKLTLPVAASLSVALERSLKDFPRQHPVWTGNPIRPEVLAGAAAAGRAAFALEAGVPTVLVTGGGTGATTLNDIVRKALPLLVPSMQLIHSTGVGKADPAVAHARYHQVELITSDMPQALAVADLVVTRAGMGSLTELAALGKPSIVVPMPGTHQEPNARAYTSGGGAVQLDQRTLTPESFASAVHAILADPAQLRAMANGMRALHVDNAAQRIAAMVLALVRE